MAGIGKPKTGGRKKGTRNKATAEVMIAAKEYGHEAIKTLAKLMRAAESDQAKIAACREILDRAYGKAPQSIEADVKGAVVIPVINVNLST